MRTSIELRPLAATLLITLSGLAASTASAVPIVMDFSNHTGLGFGVGTNQTITQNGIQMEALSGTYEITNADELNLKDFGSNVARVVEFTLVSALNFDFLSFNRQDASGVATITSNRGGSIDFDLFSPVDFSGPLWDDLSWVRVSFDQDFGEWKFNSFSFDDEPTPVPEPGTALLLALGLAGLAASRRR